MLGVWKARRIRDDVVGFLDGEEGGAQDLRKIYRMMREMLVHDLTPAKFADMYAQTLVYGARDHPQGVQLLQLELRPPAVPLPDLYRQDGTRASNCDPQRSEALTGLLSAVPSPEDVFDYLYAVLHSPSYREADAVFLGEIFPRIPVVESDAEFSRPVPLGRHLREVHLLKAPVLDRRRTTYPVPGATGSRVRIV